MAVFLTFFVYYLHPASFYISVHFKREPTIGMKCIHEENHICYVLFFTIRMTRNGESACASDEEMVSVSNNPTLKEKIRKHVDDMAVKGVRLFLWVPSYGYMGRKGICLIFDFQNKRSAFIKVKCSDATRSLMYICATDMMKIAAKISK